MKVHRCLNQKGETMYQTFMSFFIAILTLAGSQSFAGASAVKADGSSTVFPITEAVAEEFQKANPNVRVMVGLSGTGGGMKKFVVGDIDVTGASRPISESERTAAKKNKISYIELPIAYDGLAVVVNPQNQFVDSLTVEELNKIWNAQSQVKTWADIRPSWPKEAIVLYGPGTDSGTFDYFTEVINGKAKSIRKDFTASEDDNVLVQGVSRDKNALGYFGHAYYEANKNRLRLVGIGPSGKAILPTNETIKNGSYKPLSRPIFIYVSVKSLERPEIKNFVNYYLENVGMFAKQVGYVPFTDEVYKAVKERFAKRMTGTTFGSELAQKMKTIEKLVAAKGI